MHKSLRRRQRGLRSGRLPARQHSGRCRRRRCALPPVIRHSRFASLSTSAKMRRTDRAGHLAKRPRGPCCRQTVLPKRNAVAAGARAAFCAPFKAELERLRAENERLKKRERTTSLKVSEKGGVSLYGLGRFPVTLYKEQWTKLLDMEGEIRAFLRDNESKLRRKATSSERRPSRTPCAHSASTVIGSSWPFTPVAARSATLCTRGCP